MNDLAKLGRFGISGFVSTVSHVAIAWSCIRNLGLDPSIANGVAFGGATIVSCILSTSWTFGVQWSPGRVFRFLVVTFSMALISMAIAHLIQQLGFSYLTGIAAIVMIVPPLTFVFHNSWTYRNSPGAHDA
jgi:putative flippase GtrA